MLMLLFATVAASWALYDRYAAAAFRRDALTLSLLAFGVWSLLTVLWSPAPFDTIRKSLFLMLAVCAVNVIVARIAAANRTPVNAAANGICIGGLIALVVVCFEVLSGQALTRWVYELIPALQIGLDKHIKVVDGEVISISDANLNRRIGLLTLLLSPVVLALFLAPSRMIRALGFTTVGACAVVILGFSGHDSSKTAIAIGLMGFLLWWTSSRWAARLMTAAWAAAVLLVVPLALLAFNAKLYESDWLFHSARHRIVIWGVTSSEVMKSPLVGIGADGTPTIERNAKGDDAAAITHNGKFELSTGRHAHNVYLQVWYELGLVGALALVIAGLFAIRAIGKLPEAARPFAAAQFCVIATMIGSSYGLWQVWFQSAIGLAVIALIIVVSALSRTAGGD
jgi:hypothetical protein